MTLLGSRSPPAEAAEHQSRETRMVQARPMGRHGLKKFHGCLPSDRLVGDPLALLQALTTAQF